MITKKIWVFGGTGSGKTTFTKELSSILHLPYYNTDFMKYSKDFKVEYAEKTRRQNIIRLSKKKKWICEGTNAGDWIWPAFKEVDYVIILKLSPLIRLKRLYNRETNERKRMLNLSKRLSLGSLVFSYNFSQYRLHKRLAAKFNKPVVILSNRKEISRFLESLRA